MLQQLVLGSILVMTTTAVHGLFTAAVIRALRWMYARRGRDASTRAKILLLSALVLMLFLAALLEVNLWAATYLGVGAIRELEPALYFSMVTFTTLGYGDVTLGANWRLLASFQAANGTIMFGWTTAIVVAVLHRMVADSEATAA